MLYDLSHAYTIPVFIRPKIDSAFFHRHRSKISLITLEIMTWFRDRFLIALFVRIEQLGQVVSVVLSKKESRLAVRAGKKTSERSAHCVGRNVNASSLMLPICLYGVCVYLPHRTVLQYHHIIHSSYSWQEPRFNIAGLFSEIQLASFLSDRSPPWRRRLSREYCCRSGCFSVPKLILCADWSIPHEQAGTLPLTDKV